MAVTDVNLVRLIESADLPYNDANYTLHFFIHTDDKDTQFDVIRDDNNVPAYGDEPPASTGITGVYCTDRRFQLVDPNDRLLWLCEATYKAVLRDVVTGTDTTVVSWGTRTIRRVFETDKDGEPVVNAVGDPFIPAAEYDIDLLTCRIERDEDSDVVGGQHKVRDYVNTLNNASITIAGQTFTAGTAKMENVTATYDPALSKWKMAYDITVAKNDPDWTPYRGIAGANQQIAAIPNPTENAWLRRILNAGFNEGTLDDNNAFVVVPIVSEGEEAKTPHRLLRSGAKAEPSDATVWLGFRDALPVDWTPLALPASYP